MTILHGLALLAGSAAPAQASAPVAGAQDGAPLLPEPVRAMIDAAIAGGDRKAVDAVMKAARATNPQALAELDAIETVYRSSIAARAAREAEERHQQLAAAGLLEEWDGQVEFGVSRATGNTRSFGLHGAVNLDREGLDWRHRFIARADIQETRGTTTTERVLTSWQPNYKVDDRLYAYGLAQYEYDRFVGYGNRYTLGGGVGYQVLRAPGPKLDFEGGPAFRVTDPPFAETERTIAARASFNLSWKLSPLIELRQNSAFYHEAGESSAKLQTSLDSTLIGSLKARFSHNVQYESDVRAGASTVDTLSRATLVYSF